MLTDGSEMFAAGDAGDILACQCEEGGNTATHASGSCD